MEAKGRVCGLKYFTGVSDTPHPIADKQREEAVVAVAEMACFGELKDIIMYGYVSGYPNGYSNAFNFCLSAELTATAAPATAATKFDNNIVECGFEFGTGVPIATDIVDCIEGNEFGTHVPSITGIINCFVKKERERECKVLIQCQQTLLVIFVKEKKNVDLVMVYLNMDYKHHMGYYLQH